MAARFVPLRPLAIVAAGSIVAAVGIAAALIPALRIMRVRPAEMLRR